MENIKKFLIDFIEGKIKPKEFILECEKNPKIFDWINSIVPAGKTCYRVTQYNNNRGLPPYIKQDKENNISVWIDSKGDIVIKQEAVPYDVRIVWDTNTFSAYGNLGIQLNVHSTISKLITEVFPNDNIIIDNTIEEKHNLVLKVCPDYICGKEAYELVEKIIDENCKSSQKVIKEKIKETFHLEKCKYPKWAQDSEWPFSETGKPLKYISQKNKNSETIELIFEDIDTGKRITIEDIY